MFRFSIRELMLLTLVVGLALGWWLDHHRISLALADAMAWRTCAGALEHILDDSGWSIEWDLETDTVHARKKSGEFWTYSISTTHFEPGHRSK